MLRELRRHRICHHFCCWSAPATPVSEEAAETIWRALNAVSTCRLSCNIQTLFYWGRKGELYTSYHIRLISKYKDLKTKVVSWFSLVIGQNASRQLATSSENLVASAQFLVALATSESQFRALLSVETINVTHKIHCSMNNLFNANVLWSYWRLQ